MAASSSPTPLHFFFFLLVLVLFSPSVAAANTKLFREYIGAQFNNVKFTDVPINPGVTFHFILSFAIDSTTSATPTNGNFNVYWDSATLSPAAVASIKAQHPKNVRVAVSLGGDSVGGKPAVFRPNTVSSWVSNAVSSLTKIIKQYHLDGIDIDYEHFAADPNTFAECVGQLVVALKKNGVISFASIAPFDDGDVQSHYQVLWKKYGSVIDYVNFQFYAYPKTTTVPQFLAHYNTQVKNYPGGKVLVSVISDGSGGLTPANGFFTACQTLKTQGRLNGIFIWSADDSKPYGFKDEKQAQQLLAN